MKRIRPQNVEYLYFTPDDGVSQASSLQDYEPLWPNPFMREHWNAFPELRLVGAVLPWSKTMPIYWLYWDDGSDLRALDARVESGTYTDADFESCVKTQYSKTICPSCQREWDTLIIPPGDPYLGAQGLLEKKIQTWGPKFKKCPACGAELRQMVVKFLGQPRSARTPGAQWRILAHEAAGPLEVENRGILDEVVVDDWLHLEQLDDREWWMRVGDARITITISEDGKARVDIQRGCYGEVRGTTEVEGGKR